MLPMRFRYRPLSATFVTPEHGWMLGDLPCSTGRCLQIRVTADGGRSWPTVAAIPTALREQAVAGGDSNFTKIRFADPRNGWIFGRYVWATHDGGQTWREVANDNRRPYSLAAGGGVVWLAHEIGAAGGTLDVQSSPVTADRFSPSPGAPTDGVSPTLVVRDTSAWLVTATTSPLLYTTTAGGRWQQVSVPCSPAITDALAVAPSSSTQLFAACSGAGAGCQFTKPSFVSYDAGRQWRPRGPVMPTADRVGLMTAASATTAVMASSCAGSDLDATFDGGRTWAQVNEQGTGGAPWLDVGFASPTEGFAIIGQSVTPENGSRLLVTYDGGHTWNVVDLSI